MVFHERKEESKSSDSSKPRKSSGDKQDKPAEYNQGQVQVKYLERFIVELHKACRVVKRKANIFQVSIKFRDKVIICDFSWCFFCKRNS